MKYIAIDEDKLIEAICNPLYREDGKKERYNCEWDCPYYDSKTDHCVFYDRIFKEAEKNNHMLAYYWKPDSIRFINRKEGIDEMRDSYLCPHCGLHSFIPSSCCPHCGVSMLNGNPAPMVNLD